MKLTFKNGRDIIKLAYKHDEKIKIIQKYGRNPYYVLFGMILMHAIFALILGTPSEIWEGLGRILTSTDILITDYIVVGGLPAALMNSALVGLMCTLMLVLVKHEANESTIFAVWLACGFAFFGKNPINMAPILLGGYLFSVYRREPFSKYCVASIMATALAPVVSHLSMSYLSTSFILIGAVLGVALGFVIVPIAKSTANAHSGYNLYNIGFAAGLLAIIIAGFFRNSGIEVEPVSIWSYGNNYLFTVFVIILALYLIIIGLACGSNSRNSVYTILKKPGINHAGYFTEFKENCYINMGISGLFAVLVANLSGGQISGPIFGGIITIMGNSAYSKHVGNMGPVMAGAILGALINGWSISDPAHLLTIMFVTCLAPIAGVFGWSWGVIAGMIHMNVVAMFSILSGGLNLYNNGMAGGVVAMLLVPLIRSLRKESPEDNHEDGQEGL